MICRLRTLCGCIKEIDMPTYPERIVVPILTSLANWPYRENYGERYFEYVGLASDANVADYREVIGQKLPVKKVSETDQLKELNNVLSKYIKEMKHAK